MNKLKDEAERMYIDWCNNFLTVERFAEYYGLSVKEAINVIDEGRILSVEVRIKDNKQRL